jgi:hypothetical protein
LKLTVPAAAEPAGTLALHYHNAALGNIDVSVTPDGSSPSAGTIFDFGEWRSPVASRKNEDGTMSFVTIGPGIDGLEFVVRESDRKPSLVFRDAQHEYLFLEQ